MLDHEEGFSGTLRSLRRTGPVAAGLCAVAAILFFATAAGSTDIPPAVTKKAVTLKPEFVKAGRVYAADCGRCHRAPDPAAQAAPRAECRKGVSAEDLDAALRYRAGARKGKALYESRCGRCHDLIDPGSRTVGSWSKNICASDECFVEKLSGDEEQRVLLYLSSHAAKD